MLVDQWEQFERNAATLQSWLTTAESKLKLLSSLDESDSLNLGTLNQKMQLFLVCLGGRFYLIVKKTHYAFAAMIWKWYTSVLKNRSYGCVIQNIYV